MEYTNALIESTSPYLLQHAHNPVNWQPWSEEALNQAADEGKLVLVSIGYAACHWCHVMEHESFEDEEVASVMNEHFVCIKVDREERPDIDQYYMSAVQLMMSRGGWPLNVIALPDGRPIWGGTYFPKENWISSLKGVSEYYRKEPDKTAGYAAQLQEGIHNISLGLKLEDVVPVEPGLLEEGVQSWKSRFDMDKGGRIGAPKFPMPVNLEFLLYYGYIKKDNEALDFVKVTLEKMARGGIYDHVGGGFARYSVDDKWKVPHFEKMLYDNGQLLSIYSKGYQYFKSNEFKSVVYETVHFLEREMMDESGAFYSSLDADSDGEEGKFYVWQERELKRILAEDYDLFAEYFNVNQNGYWEQGNYILLRSQTEEDFAKTEQLDTHRFNKQLGNWKYKLLQEREKRVRPGLDDKTLASWNALVIQGLVDAYNAFDDQYFLQLALKNANFLLENMIVEKVNLFHSWKKGKRSINGFLEDYALVIKAFLALYEVSGDEAWLKNSKKLTKHVFTHFFDEEKRLFYFSSKSDVSSVSNHFQNEDNVIPAANSVMAVNLYRLFLILGKPEYSETAKHMLQYVTSGFKQYPMAYANWGSLMLKITEPYFEVAVCGINANLLLSEMKKDYKPNVLWAFCNRESDVPLLKNRFVLNEDLIYICREGACNMPVKSADEALKLIDHEEN